MSLLHVWPIGRPLRLGGAPGGSWGSAGMRPCAKVALQ